ncbi:MAG: ferredoxin [Gammaproteobacteria bacterium]|nr:MAG: ferredoxin [Gammaproteobacteria bacterium]
MIENTQGLGRSEPLLARRLTSESDIIARSGQVVERRSNDLFALPIIGGVLKSPRALWSLRVLILALFVYAVGYGFVLPSAEQNHVTTGFFWGLFWPLFMLVSVATLGPVICTLCPHGFIGSYLTRWGLKRPMPKYLRTPYIGLSVILIAYWGVYYTFTPFGSPLITAIFFTILTVVAVISYLLFDGMAYCKYLCPLGPVKSAFGKLGFTWLSVYESACAGCKTFDCAKVCDYKLSPFNFDKFGSMEECTLCMKCADACPSIRWRLTLPSASLLGPIKRMKNIDVWVYIMLLAVISIAMRFHHALGGTAIADEFPWSRAGQWLEQQFPVLPVMGVDSVGVSALLMAVALTVVVSIGGLYIGSRILGQRYDRTFINLGYAFAPLMVIGGLSHIGEFFFLHYYSDIGNSVIQAFHLPYGEVEPLARRGEPWLHRFVAFQYLAVIWSFYLFYRRMQLIDTYAIRKWLAFPFVSAIASVYLGLLLYTGYVFSTYGAAVMRHH